MTQFSRPKTLIIDSNSDDKCNKEEEGEVFTNDKTQ